MADRSRPEESIGSLIARFRTRQGKSQEGLAEALQHSAGRADGTPDRGQIHRWETGRRIPVPYWRRHLGLVLGIPLDDLDRAAAVAKLKRGRSRDFPAVEPLGDHTGFGQLVNAIWPAARLRPPVPGHDVDWHLKLPAGRAIDEGAAVQVQVHTLDSAWLGSLPPAGDERVARFLAVRQRAMLIGVTESSAAPVRGIDARAARMKMAGMPGACAPLTIPSAYALDDLTWGIIWALASLDESLLGDDHALDETSRELTAYERLAESAVSRRAAPGLTSAAWMWLGSDFCARHILRHLAEPGAVPAFWTREQYGEEACVWLFFRHKYDYLRRISSRFARGAVPLTRGFCIPSSVVSASPRWERTLLFLSVALMESLGIRVNVCSDAEYGDVDGFVLLPGEQAILATWVRADGIWDAGTTNRASALRDLSDVTRHAAARSVTSAAIPPLRLQALSDYLRLDWSWLRRRCAELAHYGCADLISPRSRLLSMAGLDAAVRFVGAARSDGQG
ncbi:MAG TPA: helix-turn-helix transcriptional regulator [Streptosporangiaceae bacterium]